MEIIALGTKIRIIVYGRSPTVADDSKCEYLRQQAQLHEPFDQAGNTTRVIGHAEFSSLDRNATSSRALDIWIPTNIGFTPAYCSNAAAHPCAMRAFDPRRLY